MVILSTLLAFYKYYWNGSWLALWRNMLLKNAFIAISSGHRTLLTVWSYCTCTTCPWSLERIRMESWRRAQVQLFNYDKAMHGFVDGEIPPLYMVTVIHKWNEIKLSYIPIIPKEIKLKLAQKRANIHMYWGEWLIIHPILQHVLIKNA